MKRTLFVILFCTIFSGCDTAEREQSLREREDSVSVREQQLAIKEHQLLLREQELTAANQIKDTSSATVDSLAIVSSGFPGKWAIQMACTETSCAGSAIGDSKSETWDISFSDGNIIAHAFVNNNIIRTYIGTLVDSNVLELVFEDPNPGKDAIRIIVHLVKDPAGKVTGERAVTRSDCRIIYTLALNKIH